MVQIQPKVSSPDEVFIRIDQKQPKWHNSENAAHYISAEGKLGAPIQASLVSSAVICHWVVRRAAGGAHSFL